MKNIFLLLIIGLSTSLFSQSGIQWETGRNIASNSFGNLHPRITCNDKGEAFIIWSRSSDQSLQFTKWDGQMFSAPVKINKGFDIAAASWMGPDIATRNDTIYLVMKAIPEGDANSHIYLVHSFDGGISFSNPIQVDKIGTDFSRFPTLAIDNDGHPIVAFMRFNSNFAESRWVVCRSDDYGQSFNPDIKVSGWKGSAEVCDCCPGSIVCKDNTCALFYRNNDKNIRDSWVSLSMDNGRSFINGFNIDNNNWNVSSCPASGPDGVLIDSTIYSVFMNGAKNPIANYFSSSSLSAQKFNSISKLNNNISGLNSQNFPRIASNGKALGYAWTQSVSGKAQLPLVFTNDVTTKKLPIYEIVDSVDISNTDLAISKDKIFIVWEDDVSRTIKFRSGSYEPIISSVKNIENNSEVNDYTLSHNSSQWIIKSNSKKAIRFVELFDLFGRRIYQISPNSSDNQIILEKNEIIPGVYFLKITGLKKSVTLKLMN
ncbi:MAG: T9SS type A sorting domain-containing protein [Saprospiraceae bacterium]